jgi:hypothetical protein
MLTPYRLRVKGSLQRHLSVDRRYDIVSRVTITHEL